ncbi:MAG TPA: PP0621 family protein [Dongiaceae bacterium]|nr:PP0621 family protein [Dongiaceae bacterium]
MLTRLIFIAVLVAAAWFLYRKYVTGKKIDIPGTGKNQALMRKCAHCGIHLPETESVQLEGLHFCSEAHKLEYQKQFEHHD